MELFTFGKIQTNYHLVLGGCGSLSVTDSLKKRKKKGVPPFCMLDSTNDAIYIIH
jgi:hypothetical protein